MAATTTGRRPPGRPRKSAEAKAAERTVILDAARATIRRSGPDVSLDEIAAAAGVGKPKIYAHFTDKAGLAQAIAIDVARDIEGRAVKSFAAVEVASAETMFRIGIDAFTKFMADDTNLYRFLVRAMKSAEADVFDNVLVRALQSGTAALIELLYPTMDPDGREVASYAALGQVFAACEGWLEHRRFSRRKLVDTLVALFVHGAPALAEDADG